MSETGSPNAAKSKNQEKNEAKRLAKLAKFQAKMAKQQDATKDAPKMKKEAKPAPKPVEEAEYVNATPKGEKKGFQVDVVLGEEFPSVYKPKAVESAWYDWWENAGYFKPALKADGTASDKGTYVIPIPPPNVTGTLHLGHALTNAIQDTMTRWFIRLRLGTECKASLLCGFLVRIMLVLPPKLWWKRN